jgi:hypothetical protein
LNITKGAIAKMKTLISAKEHNAARGQPGCEIDGNVELLKRIADVIGLHVSEVLA